MAPLHWGLGHATRCIPVIRELLAQDADVMIASDGAALELLRIEFPTLESAVLPSYSIRYSAGAFMPLQMLFQTPSILKTISEEHEVLEKLIDSHQIDAVIADNRYGVWSKRIRSVLITHQLQVRPPAGFGWAGAILRSAVWKKIGRFDECWIPDSEGDVNLSGALSHGMQTPFKKRFTGPLSRFATPGEISVAEKQYDLLVILSGPEPQRTMLETLMIKQLSGNHSKILLVRGTDITDTTRKTERNLTIVNHLPAPEMQQALLSSGSVICRSGYSSIMDLAAVGKKAILIPTPGQTEQEYLADYLKSRKIFFSMKQRDFRLETALKESAPYQGIRLPSSAALKNAIESLMG